MFRPRRLILAAVAAVTLAAAVAAERGIDGELRMLYWQPSILNPQGWQIPSAMFA